MAGKRFSWRNVVAAAPEFVMAGAFIITWVQPNYFGEGMVRRFMFIMLLEFIVIHSSAFLGVVAISDMEKRKKAGAFAGLVCFYCLFAAAFSAAAGSLWPLYAFLGLTLIKFPTVVLERHAERRKEALMAQWASMMFFYIVGVFLTLLIPMPSLGITPEVIAAQEFNASGIWVEEPYRVVAAGVFYFGGLGLYELSARFDRGVGYEGGEKLENV